MGRGQNAAMRIVKRNIDIVVAVGVLLFFAVLLLSLKNPTSLDDGLRHFTMAALMRDRGIFAVPGWSVFFYEGYLSTLHADPWFLSNVVMIPFTYFSIAEGLHLFILAELVVLLTGCLLLLRTFSLTPIARALFLFLIIFGDLQFLGRFLLGRPYALMTGVTLLLLWAILKNRWALATLFLALSVLLSQLFVFPLLIAVCALPAYFFAGRVAHCKSLFAVIILGLAAGFTLHPYPAEYLSYITTVFLQIPFLKSVGLSVEMQSSITDLSFMSVTIAVGFAALTVLILGTRGYRRRLLYDPVILLLSILLVIFGCAFLLWVRMIDLLWPVLILFIARLYTVDAALLLTMRQIFLPGHFRLRWIAGALSVLIVMQVIATPRAFMKNDAGNSLRSFDALRLIPSGARVLNLDWDRFFPYVAVRPDLEYATGIDPSFTYLTDPAIAEDLHHLHESGATVESLQRILEAYPSDYLLVDVSKQIPGHGSGAALSELSLVAHSGGIMLFHIGHALPAAAGTGSVVTHVKPFRVPILMYHYIRDLPRSRDKVGIGLTVTPATFEIQLDYLQKKGYHTVSFSQLSDSGAALPSKPIILTFDDGYEDAYTEAVPMLLKHKMTATFYIVTGFIGKKNYLTWEQLRAMTGSGMEIGAHTAHHLDLRKLTLAEQTREIANCIQLLQETLGIHIWSFAYPAGKYTATTMHLLEEAGVPFAVTTHKGIATELQDPLELPRVRMNNEVKMRKMF